MGLLGRLKNKLAHKRDEDLYDFRSHVLGEPPLAAPEEPKYPEPMEPLPTRSSFQQDDFTEPIVPRNRLKDLTLEPERPFERERDSGQSANYDILDRLNIIEAQLQAIRSQTETINERLKNMEMRLGPRRM